MIGSGGAFVLSGILIAGTIGQGIETEYEEEDGTIETFEIDLSIPIGVYYAMAFIVGTSIICLGIKGTKVANNALSAITFYDPNV